MSKKVWGNITWKLFHSLSFNISDDATQQDIKECIEMIKYISFNLPCPTCSQHAAKLLKNVNINNYKNKYQLIQFVYIYHNKVNENIGKQMFNKELLFQTYSNVDFESVLNDFFKVYQNLKSNRTMILYSFHRNMILIRLKNYLIINKKLYSLQ